MIRGRRPNHGAGQRGSVSIVVAGVILVALMLCLGTADVARVLAAASRAQSAADAAALAAAQELALPVEGSDPGLVAADYAARNGAVLVACRCDLGTLEAVVTVETSAGALFLLPGDRTVTARARAVVDAPGLPNG